MEHRRERIRCLQELGLHESASEEDIKKAYRTAAIKYHPDKNLGEDTTNKFQQISAAYRFLTEGDSYLQQMQQEARFEEVSILRFLFPWLFEQNFVFRPPVYNPFYDYYENMSDSDEDDKYVYLPHNAYNKHAASGASEHYRRNGNFSQTSAQHGQFFQERQAKGKAAKKKNRDAKRATKLAADKERSEPTKPSTTNKEPQARTDRVKSPTPDLPGKQQTQQEDHSPSRKGHQKSQTPDSTEARKDSTEEQTNKKSKKQIQMEQKQREKELKEINEALLRQEKERKEKMEKKRLAQEEKERQEREVREQEEKEREEEERKRAEELRQLLEIREQEKKKKNKEAARMKKLFDDFDSCTFLDDNGEFKYTDPEVKNIICRDDINHLGNASKNVHTERLEAINGLNTESLIKLQEVNQTKEKKKQQQEEEEEMLGSPNHEKLGPIGSRPPNQFNSPQSQFGQQQNYHHPGHHRDYQHPGYQGRPPQHQQYPQQQHQQQHQHPRQHAQQQYRYQQPQHPYNHSPQPQPTHQMPFWSATQPPPPLHNVNTNVPRPSGRFHPGYPNNKHFPRDRVYTQTFSSQGFQGRV